MKQTNSPGFKKCLALLAFAFSIALLGCPTSEDGAPPVLNIRITQENDSLLSFDTLDIKLFDKYGKFVQEIFHGKLTDRNGLMGIQIKPEAGDSFKVVIIGYKDGKLAMTKEVTVDSKGHSVVKNVTIKDSVPDSITVDPNLPGIQIEGDSLVKEGEVLKLTIFPSKAYPERLSLKLANAPTGAIFDTAGLENGKGVLLWKPDFTQGRGVPYSLTFTLSSGRLSVEKKINLVVVNVNRPPALARIPNQYIKESDSLAFQVVATDPDNDSVTISCEGLPEGAEFKNNRFYWKPTRAQSGNHTISLTAYDKQAMDSIKVIISVGKVNLPPEITAIKDSTVTEGDSLNFIVTTKDPDEQAVKLRAVDLPSQATFVTEGMPLGTGRFIWKTTDLQGRDEPYRITFLASDDSLETSLILRITVKNVPRKLNVVISSPKDGLITNSATVIVEWSVDSKLQPKEPFTLLVEGENTISKSFTDLDGNAGAASIKVYLDTKAPGKPTFTSTRITNVRRPKWEWVSGGGGAGIYRIKWSGDSLVDSASSTRLYSPQKDLSEGVYILSVQERDNAGNWSDESQHSISIDLTAPKVELVVTTDTLLTNKDSLSIAWKKDGALQTPFSTKLAEGLNRILKEEKDEAGNTGRDSAFVIRLANVLFVNPTALGDKSGSSWDNAMTDLQAAIGKTDSAKAMQIWVAKGIYRPTAGADRNASFILKKNITLIGGFAGNELSPDSRKISDNTTILTGEIGAAGNTYDNSRHVVTGATGSTLDGFTITQGSTDTALGSTDMGFLNAKKENSGAGMINIGASPNIYNCVFADNAGENGAAMANFKSSSPRIVNCLFTRNYGRTTNSWGGGIFSDETSAPVILNSTFRKNSVAYEGGAILSSGPYTVVRNCVFWDNQAGYGPEIMLMSGPFVLSYSVVKGGTDGDGLYAPNQSDLVNNGNVFTDDPQFVGLQDSRLGPSSPYLNKGVATELLKVDITGAPRVQSGAVDFGAYER